jgi:hypothetical protein
LLLFLKKQFFPEKRRRARGTKELLMIKLPPAVIVHDHEDMGAALAPGLPVTLLSARGFALYGGCGWWQALLQQADYTGPAFLDCGDAPGRAVEAVRLELYGLILAAEPVIFGRVHAIAAESGVILLEAAPPALDLAKHNATRRLLAWLSTGDEAARGV